MKKFHLISTAIVIILIATGAAVAPAIGVAVNGNFLMVGCFLFAPALLVAALGCLWSFYKANEQGKQDETE